MTREPNDGYSSSTVTPEIKSEQHDKKIGDKKSFISEKDRI